jgi:hypothetical protein
MAHTPLGRRGVVASYRTLHRYATTELGFGQRKTTVRVADGEPGAELQVDFGRRGTALTSLRASLPKVAVRFARCG